MNYVRRLHTRGSSDPEAVSGSSTKIEVKIAYLGDFLLIDELKREKREDPVTARKTGSSVWSVELYILESMFVFGLWIIILFKSYLYNKALKCLCQ